MLRTGLAFQHNILVFGICSSLIFDSSSAKAFASQRRVGKQRHVHQIRNWRIQDMAAENNFMIKNAAAANNVDILTKAISRKRPSTNM